MYSFELISCDTDAITIVKQDQSLFTKEETVRLTQELNSIFPDGINWEFEFNAPKMIVLKPKNYIIIKEDGKRITKGSSLKSSSLEPDLYSDPFRASTTLVSLARVELNVSLEIGCIYSLCLISLYA